MKKTKTIILIIALLLFTTDVLAHSGNTDSNGGHYNLSTSEYHYHHGESAHQHYSWGCPYDYWWVPILIIFTVIGCVLLLFHIRRKLLERQKQRGKNKMLSQKQKEIIEHFYPLYKFRVSRNEKILQQLPNNRLALNTLLESKKDLIRLQQGDKTLLSELEPEFQKYKEEQFAYWINRCKDTIEYLKKASISPEEYKPESTTTEEWIQNCNVGICENTKYLERLVAGDYGLCKELQSHERES